MHGLIFRLLLCLILFGFAGCSTFNAYERSDAQFDQSTFGAVEIQRGKPRPIVDVSGRLLGLPNRIAVGDARVDNHDISSATEMEITNYLEQNQLNYVLVRSNQYAPLNELKRMISNKKIRPIWKSTFGSYNLLKYTLLPGRLTGGDWYNPYTESLHVYSDSPAVVISRATYAQDIRNRLNPGAYAAIKDLPLAGLGHETLATKLALDWYENSSPESYESAKEVLYPNLGASYGGQLASFIPYGEVLGKIIGGGVGRLANKVKTR